MSISQLIFDAKKKNHMRIRYNGTAAPGKMILSLIALVVSTGVFGQMSVGTIGLNVSSPQYLTFSARGGLRLPNMENVEGTPYLDNQFHSARIRTKSGFDTTGVQVKFNAYGNEMIFLENGIELALDSVDMVTYSDVENGKVTEFTFKAGYPKIDNHNSNTIYRVMATGPKYQLLKYYSKKLEDVKSMGEYNKKEFVTVEYLYIYKEGGEIKKVKADKKAIQEAFPELSDRVEAVVAEKKLKLKKDTDIAVLIEELNKP
jgi:hypothetical protein